jgi:hypothetical protein
MTTHGRATHHGRAHFIPHNSGWLKYYSHVFDFVEIDSSFNMVPKVLMLGYAGLLRGDNLRILVLLPNVRHVQGWIP